MTVAPVLTERPPERRLRSLIGLVVAISAPGATCLLSLTSLVGKPGASAVFIVAVLVATLVGGLVAGLVASAASFVGLTYFFVEPVHTWVLRGDNVVQVVAFVAAALLMSVAIEWTQRANRELRSTRQIVSSALELGELGTWEFVPSTGAVRLSPEAERLLGLEPGTFGGHIESAFALLHPDDVARARRAVDEILSGGLPPPIELRIQHPGGQTRWLEFRGGVQPAGRRLPRRLVGVYSDVTERRRQEEARAVQVAEVERERALLTSVIDQMPVGVVVAEAPGGALVVRNGEVERIWPHAAELGEATAPANGDGIYHPDGRPYTPREWPLARSLEHGEVVVGEQVRFRRRDGTLGVMEVSSVPVRDREGAITAGVLAFADVTERMARERRERFLADASTLLATSLDYRETLARVATLVVPELADWCAIRIVEEGEIRTVAVHHADPEKVKLARRLQQEYPERPDAPTGAAAVIRSGRSELYPEITDELLVAAARDERHLAIARELELGSAIIAPLTAQGETLGALMLLGERGRRFDDADLAFAEEVARKAAVAVQNARLHDAQARALQEADEARVRTARLQAVTDALSEAVTRADVASVLVREGLVALRAQGAAVLRYSADRREFEALASAGYPDELMARRPLFATGTDGPSEEAVRTRDLVEAGSREEVLARWPRAAWTIEQTGDVATLTAPLLVGEDPIGVLHMSFRQPRRFDDADRSLMRTLARQCAQALERARLYEEERRARSEAERFAGRLRRLQTVVDATFMSASLDDLLTELLARLRDAVDADTAAILIVTDDGEALILRQSIGFDHPTPTRVPIGEGFAGHIGATQTHQVVPDISKVHVVSPYFEENGIRSLAGVPLVADGRLVGVVHVGSKTVRDFDREDLLLLRLVAARAAVAIDRRREQEREHRIAETLQRSLLPERLPAIEGVDVAARYVPGTVGVAVGGDWYDVFQLADGSIGVAVGDVVGHGVRAAATMGRLRNVLRAYATEGFGPAETLARLNRLACEGGDEVFATVVCAVVSPNRTRLRLASAGHPPPLLRSPDGTVTMAEGGRSLPVGAAPETLYTEVDLRIDPGSAIVLYTDGLVERRDEPIDDGIARLVHLVETASGGLDEFADRIIGELEDEDHTDDIALLALQLQPMTSTRLALRFPAEPQALSPVRDSLRTWLESHGAREDEIFDILVAVNEACSNAVEHPLGRNGSEVSLDAEVDGGDVTIVIGDRGRWRPEGPRGDRGRGMDFMSALMEGVEIQRGEDGTSVHLRRRLRRGGE